MENETHQPETEPPQGAVPPQDSTAPKNAGPATKRLTRSTREEMFFGVAGGVSEYLRIDPIFVRIAFIALSIFGGTGLVIYFVLALLLPKDDGTPSMRGA